VPLIIGEMGYALWNLPRIIATMTRSMVEQFSGTGSAFADGEVVEGLVGVLGCLMLLIPMGGVVYLSVKIGGRLLRAAKRPTAGRPRLRVTLCALLLAGLTGLSYAWTSGLTPQPLPKKPPIAPILQPGVSTEEPQPRRATTPDGNASTSDQDTSDDPAGTGPGAVPSSAAGRSTGSGDPTPGTSTDASTSASPASSATAPGSATGGASRGPASPAQGTSAAPEPSSPGTGAGPSSPASSPTPSESIPPSPTESSSPAPASGSPGAS
jgi:putative peptide zinc metalloprotease protein